MHAAFTGGVADQVRVSAERAHASNGDCVDAHVADAPSRLEAQATFAQCSVWKARGTYVGSKGCEASMCPAMSAAMNVPKGNRSVLVHASAA